MSANACPSCGTRLMSFPEFFRAVQPATVRTCPSCGCELRRSGAVWVVLLAAGLLYAAFLIALTTTDWSALQILLVGLASLPVWIVAVKLIGWAAVPWKATRTAENRTV
jgi:fatty acid desaturase